MADREPLLVTPADAQRIARILRMVENMRGPGVRLSEDGITINPPTQAQTETTPLRERPVRMKIKTAADGNGVAICNTWDGTTAGSTDIPVRVFVCFSVAQVLFASRVTPNTGVQYNSADVIWQEHGTTQYQPFPVRLSSDGGVAGTNKTTACTYTYTVKDAANSITLGSTIAMTGKGNGWRALKLQLTGADYGMAYLDGNTIKLIFANEYPAGEQDCT